jgi:hypothetical protein
MTLRTDIISKAAAVKPTKTKDAIDVAARYFVYGLYEATDGTPKEWWPLRGLGERLEVVARAVERGWVIVQGKTSVALTDEGRRLARRGR